MAVYRYQVTSVGMWRGKIKRWNTTFHRTSSTATSDLFGRFSSVCYKNPGDAVGNCSGGIASITVYNATGGAPIAQTVYFDWQAPSTWIPFTGTAWSGTPEGTPLDASGESALLIYGPMAGLSSSGKPVATRKYIHAIPSRSSATYTDPDIPAPIATALGNAFPTYWLANPAGVSSASTKAEQYYFNHQRVRGRRRPKAQVATQAFAGGVVAGSGLAPSGAASPQ